MADESVVDESTDRSLRLYIFTLLMLIFNGILGVIYKVSPFYVVGNVFLSAGLFMLLGLRKAKKEDA